MKKKEFRTCIAFQWNLKENVGGPSGYLYNLKKGLDIIESNFEVFSKKENMKNTNASSAINKKNKMVLIFTEIKICFYCLRQKDWYKNGYDLEKYDVVHFESIEDLYDCLKIKGKKKYILTPHRPEPLFVEKINEIKTQMKTNYKFYMLKKVLQFIEKKVYKNCDGYIFPSPEAMNIYMDFPGFKKHIEGKPVEYLITGCNKVIGSEKYNIGEDCKVISYIGRHNKIKGYEFIKNCFLNNYSFFETNNLKVICAGKVEKNDYPNSDRWKELGMIKDPYNLIKSSSVLVLPNLNTYFDLIALEIISQGKILLASNTGGNITLSRYTNGVVLFEKDNAQDFLIKLNEILSLPKEQRIQLENENINFFDEYCELSKFAANYIKVIKRMEERLLIPKNK